MGWREIVPDKHFDWIGQRDDSFGEFISLGDKKDKTSVVLFENYSAGILSGRDSYIFSYSKTKLEKHMKSLIKNFNAEIESLIQRGDIDYQRYLGSVIENSSHKISWTTDLKIRFNKGKLLEYDAASIRLAIYRPFCKQWHYFHPDLNERFISNGKYISE